MFLEGKRTHIFRFSPGPAEHKPCGIEVDDFPAFGGHFVGGCHETEFFVVGVFGEFDAGLKDSDEFKLVRTDELDAIRAVVLDDCILPF